MKKLSTALVAAIALFGLGATDAVAKGRGYRTFNASSAAKNKVIELKSSEKRVTVRVPANFKIITVRGDGSTWSHGALSGRSGSAVGTNKKGDRLYRVGATSPGDTLAIVPAGRVTGIAQGKKIDLSDARTFVVRSAESSGKSQTSLRPPRNLTSVKSSFVPFAPGHPVGLRGVTAKVSLDRDAYIPVVHATFQVAPGYKLGAAYATGIQMTPNAQIRVKLVRAPGAPASVVRRDIPVSLLQFREGKISIPITAQNAAVAGRLSFSAGYPYH